MAGAKARVRPRARRKETEPLDLHEVPLRADDSVTRLRIVPVGRSTAARSGGTLQINCTVRPPSGNARAEYDDGQEQPEVIYTKPVWSAPAPSQPVRENDMHDQWPRQGRGRFADVPTAVFPAPRPNLVELQVRATQALAGLQAGLRTLQSQGIDLRKWPKSSIAWTAALGVYALVLFLIALLTS
jgi:hypothetical protein